MVQVRVRRELLPARLVYTAASQRDNLLRNMAETEAMRRLRAVMGWKIITTGALVWAGADGVLVDQWLYVTIPPWLDGFRVRCRMDIGVTICREM